MNIVRELTETTKTNACQDCSGACCTSGVIIPLTKKEVTQLRAAGTVLDRLDKSKRDGHHAGFHRDFYKLIGDCANLGADASCQDYDNRPRACREFKAGGVVCAMAQDWYATKPVDLPMPTMPEQRGPSPLS